MDNWSDIGIILKIEKRGEKGNLLNVLTNNHGRHMGWFNNFNNKQSLRRQTLDATIMLFIGTNLIIFLNTLPLGALFDDFLGTTWNNLYKGILLITYSLGDLSRNIIILLLLITSIILIIGGLWRLIRIYSKWKRFRSRKNE